MLADVLGKRSTKSIDEILDEEDYLLEDPEALGSTFVELAPSVGTVKEQILGAPRASSLYSCCIRQLVLRTILKKKKDEYVNFQSKLTFALGNALHYHLQNDGSIFGDRRYGYWKCTACGKIRRFGPPPTKPCPRCKARAAASIYFEFPLVIRSLPLTGHPDLFLRKTSTGLLRIAEIKTIDGDAFEGLVGPSIEHVWQITAYLWACKMEEAKLPAALDTKYGYICYFSKKVKQGMFPLRIFPVRPQEQVISQIKDKLRLYRKGIKSKGRTLPAKMDYCKTREQWTVKTCPVGQECFVRGD